MYSLAWPDMFNAGSTLLAEDKRATLNNLRLVLGSEKLGLFGDPKFGSNLKRFLFEQNSTWLHDMVRDEIYTIVRLYIPQLIVDRDNIRISTEGPYMEAEITGRWFNDPKMDMFSIRLTEDES